MYGLFSRLFPVAFVISVPLYVTFLRVLSNLICVKPKPTSGRFKSSDKERVIGLKAAELSCVFVGVSLSCSVRCPRSKVRPRGAAVRFGLNPLKSNVSGFKWRLWFLTQRQVTRSGVKTNMAPLSRYSWNRVKITV